MTALLNNRYRILKVLGAGGFGVTSVAEDTHLPSLRRCVVKELKPATEDPRILQIIRERFQKEAATLEMLGQASRQIPGLYAYFAENERFYLVQELVDGPTLTQCVMQNGPLGEEEARRILTSLLKLLEYVHGQGIIHRDIKPDNILLRRQDNQPVLIDFGAVKETVTSTLDSTGRATASIVIGTPGFIPLEQAAGRPLYSSDLYSLGLTIVFLLTAKIPQELTDQVTGAIHWIDRTPGISPAFAAVINKSIEPDSRTRYKSAHEMLAALAQLSAGTAQPAQREWGSNSRETLAATPPPSFTSQGPLNPPAGLDWELPSRETQRMTPPPVIPSPPSPPVSQSYPSARQHLSQPPAQYPSQQAPMPPSADRQGPASFGMNQPPTPQPQYPPPMLHPPRANSGMPPARVAKKGMSTAAKIMLVIVGLAILSIIGIIVLLALAQFASEQAARQSLSVQPTATPLALASVAPYQEGKGALPTPTPPQFSTYIENGLDVSGRWQFSLTMLDGETMSDALVLQQDGAKITGTDDEGDSATGSLNGNKLNLAYKQPLSAEDRAAMAPVFGDIRSFTITLTGIVQGNTMSGSCSMKTNTGLSVSGICKWTATR